MDARLIEAFPSRAASQPALSRLSVLVKAPAVHEIMLGQMGRLGAAVMDDR